MSYFSQLSLAFPEVSRQKFANNCPPPGYMLSKEQLYHIVLWDLGDLELAPTNLRTWREEYARQMIRLDFEPIPDTRFVASMQPVVPGMRMLRSSFSPGFTLRDDDLVKDGDDSIAIVISRCNRIDVTKSIDFQLALGDAAMLRVSEPGRLGSIDNFQYVAFIVPAADLKHRGVEPESERFLSRTSEGLQLLRTYISALEKQRFCGSPPAIDAIERHMYDLVALACNTQTTVGESCLSAVASARLFQAIEHIAHHFADPALNLEAVAHAQNVSPRYLQRLFETSSVTFNERVNELRLQRARGLLSQPAQSGTSISDIALEAGFSDISHFNRIFKRRFGAPPSAFRAPSNRLDSAD